jgi:hypothetical protein
MTPQLEKKKFPNITGSYVCNSHINGMSYKYTFAGKHSSNVSLSEHFTFHNTCVSKEIIHKCLKGCISADE